MPTTSPRRSLEERARLGTEIYERSVRPLLRPEHDGKFVAVDIDRGEFEIDENDYQAVARLGARIPGAEIWIMMAGRPAAYKFAGAR